LKAELGELVSATELGLSIERAETKKVTLVVDVGRRIAVTVTDGEAENAPRIANASVVLAEEGLSPFPIYGRTDSQGIVVLGPIPDGATMVSASAEGFVPTSAVMVDGEAMEVRVSLVRGGAIVGEVVDDRGFPVGGAMVEVIGTDNEGMPIAVTRAMTAFREDHFDMSLPGSMPLIPVGELGVMLGPIPDLPREEGVVAVAHPADYDPWVTNNDGVFRAEPIPPGRVQVIVRHPDYVEAVSEMVTLKSGGEAFVRVVLQQGGFLEGRVLDGDRNPVAGARVELAAATGSLERVTYADDSGIFVFPAVPNEVLVSVARPDAPSDVVARVIVEIPDRGRKEIEIVLPKERNGVSVHVTDDRGYALDRVEVRAVSLDPAVPLRRTLFTDDNGDVEVPDAAGLALRFSLHRPGKSPHIEEADPAPSKLSFELTEGIVGRGQVTGRDGRDKIGDAEVVLYTRYGVRRAVADADGEFEVPDLGPGRVRMVASHSAWANGEKIVEVKADSQRRADLGAIDLSEAGVVEGEVVDPNEEPLAGVRVGFGAVPTYLPLGPLPPGITSSNKQGEFVLKGVPAGDAIIEAYSLEMGRASVEVKVRAGETTSRVLITLSGEGRAKKEAKGAGSVALTLGERSEKGGKAVIVVMVPANGEAELAGIEPGERLLSVSGNEVRSIEAARKRLSGPLSEDVVVTVVADEEGAKPRRLRVRRERVRR
jgi:protocatechuate 3,4-dioxygenase beta subunit